MESVYDAPEWVVALCVCNKRTLFIVTTCLEANIRMLNEREGCIHTIAQVIGPISSQKEAEHIRNLWRSQPSPRGIPMRMVKGQALARRRNCQTFVDHSVLENALPIEGAM